MRKLLILICLLAVIFVFQTNQLNAQQPTISSTASTTTAIPTPGPLDEKTQKKLDKAKSDIAKQQEQLTKKTSSFEKGTQKFEHEQAKGKLSPVQVEKMDKKLSKAERDILKLKKQIEDNQAIIDKIMPPAPKM